MDVPGQWMGHSWRVCGSSATLTNHIRRLRLWSESDWSTATYPGLMYWQSIAYWTGLHTTSSCWGGRHRKEDSVSQGWSWHDTNVYLYSFTELRSLHHKSIGETHKPNPVVETTTTTTTWCIATCLMWTKTALCLVCWMGNHDDYDRTLIDRT